MMYSMKGKLENLSSLEVLKKKKSNGIKFLIFKKSKRLKEIHSLVLLGRDKN